jgi:hypothetical protein
MYGATAEEDSRQVPRSRPNDREVFGARRIALGLAVIAIAALSFSHARLGSGASPADQQAAMASSSALAPHAALIPDQAEYGGQGGRPFKITTALGEFYFIADTEGVSGMEPTVFQYLPNDFSGDAVTPVGGVLKRSLIPEFLCYCAKRIFFTTASKGLWYVEELGHDVIHYLDFPEKATLRGISADYRFGKVYFCESTAGKVYMVKADDATSVEVVAEIPGAFDVVIDVVTYGDSVTSMYVSSPTDNCIYKARIEGSDIVGVKKFVHAAGIRSLDLSGNTTLFWVSAGSIYSVNLPSGVMARTVATNFVELTDIAAERGPESSIYVTDMGADAIYSMGQHGAHLTVAATSVAPRAIAFPPEITPPAPSTRSTSRRA